MGLIRWAKSKWTGVYGDRTVSRRARRAERRLAKAELAVARGLAAEQKGIDAAQRARGPDQDKEIQKLADILDKVEREEQQFIQKLKREVEAAADVMRRRYKRAGDIVKEFKGVLDKIYEEVNLREEEIETQKQQLLAAKVNPKFSAEDIKKRNERVVAELRLLAAFLEIFDENFTDKERTKVITLRQNIYRDMEDLVGAYHNKSLKGVESTDLWTLKAEALAQEGIREGKQQNANLQDVRTHHRAFMEASKRLKKEVRPLCSLSDLSKADERKEKFRKLVEAMKEAAAKLYVSLDEGINLDFHLFLVNLKAIRDDIDRFIDEAQQMDAKLVDLTPHNAEKVKQLREKNVKMAESVGAAASEDAMKDLRTRVDNVKRVQDAEDAVQQIDRRRGPLAKNEVVALVTAASLIFNIASPTTTHSAGTFIEQTQGTPFLQGPDPNRTTIKAEQQPKASAHDQLFAKTMLKVLGPKIQQYQLQNPTLFEWDTVNIVDTAPISGVASLIRKEFIQRNLDPVTVTMDFKVMASASADHAPGKNLENHQLAIDRATEYAKRLEDALHVLGLSNVKVQTIQNPGRVGPLPNGVSFDRAREAVAHIYLNTGTVTPDDSAIEDQLQMDRFAAVVEIDVMVDDGSIITFVLVKGEDWAYLPPGILPKVPVVPPPKVTVLPEKAKALRGQKKRWKGHGKAGGQYEHEGKHYDVMRDIRNMDANAATFFLNMLRDKYPQGMAEAGLEIPDAWIRWLKGSKLRKPHAFLDKIISGDLPIEWLPEDWVKNFAEELKRSQGVAAGKGARFRESFRKRAK